MKVSSSKSESKKRKRDDSQETISESPKRTKVHAQRKFAQGAAFNSPVITPIKDKARPAASVTTPGPMLTSKRPNTEDFLTFLCFRRTSILPPKLDFFKDGAGNQNVQSEQSSGSQKANADQPSKPNSKKSEKKEESKKNQPAAVQALRKKYQEQRLAKQKPTNVTKLAQKVKGKNMMRTRSTTLIEEKKPVSKKEPVVKVKAKEAKSKALGLRSGLQRNKPPEKKAVKTPVKIKNVRGGLRSSAANKTNEKETPEPKTATKKPETIKKVKIEVAETAPKRTKRTEGFSDFSSDDNEPLLAVKKLKAGKKPVKEPEKKPAPVKTRSQNADSDTPQARPTRKTKEAAAIYMEMITKKLVSPDKSGDDDLSSVDSFPELPNAKRNEQRESEIKAKALATKKEQKKLIIEEAKKMQKKAELAKKLEANKSEKEDSGKKGKKEKPAAVKKATKKEETVKKEDSEEKEKVTEADRRSTRSKRLDDLVFKSKSIDELSLKKSKLLVKKAVQKRTVAKPIIQPQPVKKAKIVNAKDDSGKRKASPAGKKETKTEKVTKKQVEKAKKEKEKVKAKSEEKKSKEEKEEKTEKVNKATKVEKTEKAAKAEKVDRSEKAPKQEKTEKVEKVAKQEKEKVEKAAKQEKVEKVEKVAKQEKEKVEKAAKQEKVEKVEKAAKQEKVEKVEKAAKQEKVEKSEKVTKVEKTEKAAKAEKVEKTEKVEKSEKVARAEKADKSEKATKSEKVDKSEKVAKGEKVDKSEKATKGEKVDKSEKVAKQEKPVEKASKPEKVTKAEKPEKMEKAATKIENIEKASKPEKSEKVGKESKNEKPKKQDKTPKVEKTEKTTKAEKKEKTPEPEKKEEPTTLNKRPTRKCSTVDKIWIDIDGFTSDEEDFIDMRSITTSRPTKKEESSKQEVKKKAKTSTPKETQGKKKTKKEIAKEKEEADAKKKNKENAQNETDTKKETKAEEEPSKNKKDEKSEKKPEPETSKKKEEPKKAKKNEKPPRSLRKRSSRKSDSDSSSEEKSVRRTRPIRQCSTGDKMWIESDNSNSFDFYATSSEEEDNVPIVDINKKDKPVEKAEPEPKPNSSVVEKPKDKAEDCDNFSESDEEPLKKKADAKVEEVKSPITKPMPELHPIKKDVMKTPEKQPLWSPKQITPPAKPPEPKNVESKPEIQIIKPPDIFEHKPDIPVVCSVPNRIEMILQTLKSDKRMETTCTSTVSHMSSPIIADPKITYQIPTSVVCTFPPRSLQRREPINTHGLDLLSEVALPKSKESNLQTERIEKWLKDSLAAEKKETFPVYEEVKYKSPTKLPTETYLQSVPKASHQELRKFEQIEIMESQKLKRKPETPKKTVTSVQDLLKLQKERKEVPKQIMTDNTPHSKNCQCNSCVVKKAWFKNKPVPKSEELKITTTDLEKPFESLSKAFVHSPKMSVSVAPIMHTASTSTMTRSPEKKPIFQQRKLSFLERMKERERKEALVKANPNAFSPNNESSVYAFEPEPEPTSTPFRSKTRDSRTSSTNTSKSEEDVLKICEDEVSQVSSGTQVDKKPQDPKISKVSASIAVQVNLDNESATQVETPPEALEKSIEISTQTEVPEEDSDSPMFYIPLQQSNATTCSSDQQQLIQGVALKLGTEGPVGPNQRVIMKAKLVTKPQDMKAVVMPQPKRLFDQKNNNPPVGTVQPTTRKPPEILSDESNTIKSVDSDSASTMKRNKTDPEFVSQASTDSGMGSEVSSLKTNINSPSSSKLNKSKEKSVQSGSKEHLDESSPSSSKTKRLSKQKSSETVINPTNSTWLPPPGTPSKLVEAPTFHPTEKEFQDPFEFFERIRPAAEKFGLCRIVPPSNFKPDCKVTDDMRFTAYNQYVHRMLHRWGPNVKEMMAIKKYLATQSISLKQPPWIGGIEVDLPRLYQSVQNCGGLMKVMEKKKWHQVADMMKIPKAAQDRVTKLDDIYCKYLLPYDTLSHDERQKLFDEVEKDWLDRQKSSEESQESQTEEESEEENYIDECEECIAKGRNMALNQFYRIARNTMSMWFKNSEPSPAEVENEFWKHVNERNHHVCVHSGSIDSSGWGYGFPIGKNNTFSKHPWNLKVLTNNSGSVLRSLGPVMGVTVPTLHVGMVFTAFCWYRDPHGLPWIEYLHTGAPKKWYGISDDNSTVFREAITKSLPRYIKNKTIWLPSDTAMVPPNLLVEHGVSLCHTIQEPGQFILVFPRAYTSSICTGYLVSESVYFAQPNWLATAEQVFKDIQDSCEPTMFSLEKLLFSIANDSRSSVEVLKQVLPMVWHVRQKEIDGRKTLFNLGLKTSERLHVAEFGSKKKKGRWAQDDDGDYECEICRTNLYVSLVTNSHEEGVYCLPHAIELLTQKRHHLKYSKLMYSFSQDEMNELVEKLEQRIENKTQKKLQGKSSTSSSSTPK